MKNYNSYRTESVNLRILKENKLKIKKNKKNNMLFKHKILSSNILYYLFKNKPENLILQEHIFYFKRLPKSFDNFKIIFVSDLHLDIKPNSLDYIKNINIPDFDLLCLGGDYFDKSSYTKENISDLKKFISYFNTKNKIGVLGNHDGNSLIKEENNLNLNFLVNESFKINKGNEEIIITGIDDYTVFDSEYQSKSILKNDSFKILLSHNPDFLIDKNINHYDLQLSGHTHGGQIKLPFIIHSSHTKYKKCIQGSWKHKSLQGLTSSGFGCSGYPLRNIDPEILLITLKCT